MHGVRTCTASGEPRLVSWVYINYRYHTFQDWDMTPIVEVVSKRYDNSNRPKPSCHFRASPTRLPLAPSEFFAREPSFDSWTGPDSLTSSSFCSVIFSSPSSFLPSPRIHTTSEINILLSNLPVPSAFWYTICRRASTMPKHQFAQLFGATLVKFIIFRAVAAGLQRTERRIEEEEQTTKPLSPARVSDSTNAMSRDTYNNVSLAIRTQLRNKPQSISQAIQSTVDPKTFAKENKMPSMLVDPSITRLSDKTLIVSTQPEFKPLMATTSRSPSLTHTRQSCRTKTAGLS